MMKTQKSVSDAPGRSVPEERSVCRSENSRCPSDVFAAACVSAMVVPAWMWAYDGKAVLAASAATFAAVCLLGRAVGLLRAVVRGLRCRPRYVEYVSRRPFDEDRRLGYVSADVVCRASKGVGR